MQHDEDLPAGLPDDVPAGLPDDEETLDQALTRIRRERYGDAGPPGPSSRAHRLERRAAPAVVRHETFVLAKPARVWDALVREADRWYATEAEVESEPGGTFTWR